MSTAPSRSDLDVDDLASHGAITSAPAQARAPMPWERLFEAGDLRLSQPALASEASLRAFEGQRRILMAERLGLPPRLLRGLRLAALGTPSLPAAVVCARWGAQVTMVEAGGGMEQGIAHKDQIDPSMASETVFRRFGLDEVFAGSAATPGQAAGRYDWVLADRCAAASKTIVPDLNTLRTMAAPDGFVQVSFFSRRGAFVETLIRALVAGLAAQTGRSLPEVARTVMMTKWDGQGSGRHFAAWVQGHLLHPDARMRRLVDPSQLLRSATSAGLSLQASAPAYRPPMEATPGASGSETARRDGHLVRAALAHATGAPVYYSGHLSGAAEIGALIDAAMGAADDCCDLTEANRFQAAAAALRALSALTSSRSMWLGHPKDEGVGDLISGLAGAFDNIAAGLLTEVERFCAENLAFHRLWGTPIHHVVFTRNDALLDRPQIPDFPEDMTPGRPRP